MLTSVHIVKKNFEAATIIKCDADGQRYDLEWSASPQNPTIVGNRAVRSHPGFAVQSSCVYLRNRASRAKNKLIFGSFSGPSEQSRATRLEEPNGATFCRAHNSGPPK